MWFGHISKDIDIRERRESDFHSVVIIWLCTAVTEETDCRKSEELIEFSGYDTYRLICSRMGSVSGMLRSEDFQSFMDQDFEIFSVYYDDRWRIGKVWVNETVIYVSIFRIFQICIWVVATESKQIIWNNGHSLQRMLLKQT